jgi:LPS sulfotransferase NodH
MARRGYAICGEPRSGSTFLAHALHSTGVLGAPYEYLRNRDEVRPLRADPSRFEELLARASTPNGVYGIKLFSDHADHAAGIGWSERLPQLHFVYLEREDLLGQAISLAKALQSGQYKAHDPRRSSPRYDRRLIAGCLARIAYGRARWQCYFARNGIAPLRLTYEQAVRDPQAAAEAIARLIGLDERPQVDPERGAQQRQRDEQSEEWRRRFIAEAGDRDYLDAGLLFSRRRGGGRFARLLLGPGR